MTELLGIADDTLATKQESKVAAVTLSFWILKIIATTVGDVSGDALSIILRLGYVTSLIIAVAFIAAALTVQLRSKRFHPLLYWLLILVSSTIGAELSDTMDRGLHLGYISGTAILFLCLAATLVVWKTRLGRLQIYPIYERGGELFYWLAVIFANSLGSVLGDLMGDRLGLGLAGTVAFNAGMLAVLWLIHYFTRMNKTYLFWAAFVFSRA